uniref:tyrosine-type recombinase/integrase n=1 Tax=Deinococcus sp. VB142 TaxID=3112952 RepID=UPI00403F6B27
MPREQRAALAAAVQNGEALPNISPHDLRHTYATLALRSGIPIEVVSRNLGHATTSITLDIYRYVLDGEWRSRVVPFLAYTPPLPTGVGAALN